MSMSESAALSRAHLELVPGTRYQLTSSKLRRHPYNTLCAVQAGSWYRPGAVVVYFPQLCGSCQLSSLKLPPRKAPAGQAPDGAEHLCSSPVRPSTAPEAAEEPLRGAYSPLRTPSPAKLAARSSGVRLDPAVRTLTAAQTARGQVL